jgi:hypothetical protein
MPQHGHHDLPSAALSHAAPPSGHQPTGDGSARQAISTCLSLFRNADSARHEITAIMLGRMHISANLRNPRCPLGVQEACGHVCGARRAQRFSWPPAARGTYAAASAMSASRLTSAA